MPYNQQRSPEWLEWRRDKVTASDAAVIMGANTFKSIGELFDEKLGIRMPEAENEAMARGNALEDEARSSFEEATGHVVFPQVCIHKDFPWMTASLDGLSLEKDVAVEIKCPGFKSANGTYNNKVVPDYYFPQIQHQMSVTGLKEIYYWSYYMEGGVNLCTLLIVKRDDEYIEQMIAKEKRFYDLLLEGFSQLIDHENKMSIMKDDLYKMLI